MTIRELHERLGRLVAAGLGAAKVRVADGDGLWGFGTHLHETQTAGGAVLDRLLVLDTTDEDGGGADVGAVPATVAE